MKKFICIILALLMIMSSTVVFANNGKGYGLNGKGNDKKYYDKMDDYNKSLNNLKELLKKYNKEHGHANNHDWEWGNYDGINQKYTDDIIDKILRLKDKNNDESTSIFINGKEYSSNEGNIIRYKNFQLPTNPITEGLGANLNWNEKTHVITISKGNISLVINLESKKITINSFEIKNSVLTINKKNNTIVLIKFIAQALGNRAEIYEDAGAVIVDDDGITSINDNITGKGLNQFEYSSKWNYGAQTNAYLGDNHWSSNSDAYYKVRFNGTQIKLYGATSTDHGIAAVSIDNGTETYVDFYTYKRADNVLVYTSPVLSQGVHTLKVRVTGSKNSRSSGTSVTADRVNIISSSTNQDYIDTQIPTVPTGLVVTAPISYEAALNWNASYDNVGISGYKIYRNGNQVGTVTSGTSYRDTGLAAGTVYTYFVVAYDAAGNYSNHSSTAIVTTPATDAYNNGNGLKGEYYNNKNLTDLKLSRIDNTINDYWYNDSPDSRIDTETFSIRWIGQLEPLYSETYTFYTTSDDGVRLWVNGKKIIDNWTDHSATENSGKITLTAGQKYNIKLEYYNNSGEGEIKLEWSSTRQAKEIVPECQLYSDEVDTQAPTAPVSLTATTVSANQINLRWTRSTDDICVAGYEVYRNGYLVDSVAAAITTYSDTGLSANTSYSYTVLAYDTTGNCSNQCSPVLASTKKLSYSNLALGKTVTTDSEENGNPATNGNDGNLTTRWCAYDGSFNHWWKVDLVSNYNLTGTEVNWEKNKAYKYKIEVSTDGSNWTLVVDKTKNTTAVQTQTDSFTANAVRYVRITITGFDSDCWASFNEFKVF